jgi:ferredoxin
MYNKTRTDIFYDRSGLKRGRKMSKKVYIDEEVCPEVFKLNNETEKAEVIKPEGGPEDLIEEAMEMCPVECIHWED